MRRSKVKADATGQRAVATVARRIRKNGRAGVGVAELMREAGVGPLHLIEQKGKGACRARLEGLEAPEPRCKAGTMPRANRVFLPGYVGHITHRKHATAVDTRRHLAQWLVYIDLNMIRAGIGLRPLPLGESL